MLVMSTAAANLRLLGNPVQGGASRLVEFFQQARTRAISSGSAQTVYPESDSRVLLRASKHCDDLAGPAAPASKMDIPPGAFMPDTGWTVCFGSRGLPTNAVDVRIKDAGSPVALSVKVLLGGAVRVQ